VKTYYVYILASIRRVLYIGVTSDLEKRVDEHWFKAHPSSFSARYRCNRLVHFEEYSEVTDAIGREKQLKAWRRAKKIALIESFNPEWRDMSYRNVAR
jgi:putative endonuclease